MWYIAARFTSGTLARECFSSLKSIVLPRPINVTPLSLMYEVYWYAVVVAEEAPDQESIRLMTQALTREGRLTELPQGVVLSLLERRRERMKHAQPTRSGLLYENHELTPVAHYEPSSTLSAEEHKAHIRGIVDDLLNMGYPYKEVYRSYFKFRLQKDQETHGPEMVPGISEALVEAHMSTFSRAHNYMLTESGRVMHDYVSTGSDEWIEPHNAIWLEHDVPQPVGSERVRAVYTYALYEKSVIDSLPIPSSSKFFLDQALQHFKHKWFVNVINDTTEIIVSYLYEPDRGYTFNFDHICPYEQCEKMLTSEALRRYSSDQLKEMRVPSYASMLDMSDMPVVFPCKQCLANLDHWSQWMSTTMRMIRGDYATSPEPMVFPTRDHSYTEKKRVPRAHGKGAPKEKKVTVSIPYTYVTYDVSMLRDRHQEEQEEHTVIHRVNWLSRYPKEARIYVRRDVPDIVRTYKGHHYRALIQRVLSGITAEGDEEYELINNQDGTHSVRGTVHFPHGKYFPLLRPELKQKEKFTKITASQYTQKEPLDSSSLQSQ